MEKSLKCFMTEMAKQILVNDRKKKILANLLHVSDFKPGNSASLEENSHL